MTIAAAIPVFNGRATLAQAIGGVRAQTSPVADLVIIDDGSTDGSAELAESLGARVIAHKANLGRGAARATAVRECSADLILFCDAGIRLPENFVELALPYFREPPVAGVFGRVLGAKETLAHRWRERHLFKSHARESAGEDLLATGGALLRRSAVLAAGDFDTTLRAGEDADLGRRLKQAGVRVLFDPRLELTPLANDTVGSVLKRYARWNGQQRPSWADYLRFVNYGVKVMVREDLRAGDFGAALVSLASPHVLFWHARKSRVHEHSR